jgi:ATP-dependent exoDNAse (exonuclease V) alpha subunit
MVTFSVTIYFYFDIIYFMMENKVKLSTEQEHALHLMLSKKNVFISGNAGTGKTFVVKEFIRQFDGNCVIVAPTGVAAVNVGGQTIHSFFCLPICLMSEDTVGDLKFRSVRQKIENVDCIVIDEISMVRSDVLWAIDKRCKECVKGPKKKLPFGGKQIIAVGDFFQLPPIVSDRIEEDYLIEHFNGEYAFNAPIWSEAKFETILLKESFRQKNDNRFIEMLNKVRAGDLSCSYDNDRNVIDVLNDECTEKDKLFDKYPIRLCTTNIEAQNVNNAARAKINAVPYQFNAVVTGKFNIDEYPTEGELVLKVGCRVMVLCNKHKPLEGFFYVNGDCGEILDIRENNDASTVRIKFDNGETCWIGFHEWKKYKYVLEIDRLSGKKIIRQEEIGSFLQLPLRLAYATTIHKSQGMTLDAVDLRLGNGCFAHGQLYTALSRARSLNGLKFERNVDYNDLILDERVVDFYKSLEDPLNFLCSNSTERIEVPKEHLDKIRKYLATLT